MANRCTLHKTKVTAFILWLDQHNIPWRYGKGTYELLQVFDKGGWHKLYARDHMPEHVTVQDALMSLVQLFLHGQEPRPREPLPEGASPTKNFVTVGKGHVETNHDPETPPWDEIRHLHMRACQWHVGVRLHVR